MKEIGIGVIGCGVISEKYIDTMKNVFGMNVVAVTDIVEKNARTRSAQFDIARICASSAELAAMPQVDIVVVLTTPTQHFDVCEVALNAGKHVYVEKPFALTREEGKTLVALAEKKGVMLSCAPDTMLSAGMQTSRKLLDDGWIGTPIAATSHIINGGHESWHPNPEFFYKKGGGPLFDVAPYYITALAYLLGPVESAMCSAKTTYPERVITSQPLCGQRIKVEVPTHLAGILNMQGGVIATILHSFDVPHTRLGWEIEIYGTEGTLIVPSPCLFDGEILYKKNGMEDWASLPMLYCYNQDYRGIGVAEMADALANKRKQRLGADLAYHVLDVMTGLVDSWKEQKAYRTQSCFERTPPMRPGVRLGEIQ